MLKNREPTVAHCSVVGGHMISLTTVTNRGIFLWMASLWSLKNHGTQDLGVYIYISLSNAFHPLSFLPFRKNFPGNPNRRRKVLPFEVRDVNA